MSIRYPIAPIIKGYLEFKGYPEFKKTFSPKRIVTKL